VDSEQAKVLNSEVTVAILAGGKSARFGSDKALATIPGEPISFLERAVVVARAVADQVIVIGPTRPGVDRLDLRFVPDRFPGEGPAGGVITALVGVATARLVVLACDQPLIAPLDLIALLEDGRGHPAVAFASSDGYLQPLPCYLDVATCRDMAISAFDSGSRSLREILQTCGVASIPSDRNGRLADIDTVDDYHALADSAAPGRRDGPDSV
jgi:molybdopterin-guanine dinucleotide biosynthesis protein A